MKKKRTITHTLGGKNGATCEELLTLINQYVDGHAAPPACKELETHLADCNPCRVVVDTLRKTITLYRHDKPCTLPAGFHKQLHACLRARWKTPPMTASKQGRSS